MQFTWGDIGVGLMVSAGFLIGVFIGRRTDDRPKKDWPTPYRVSLGATNNFADPSLLEGWHQCW